MREDHSQCKPIGHVTEKLDRPYSQETRLQRTVHC
jgi:hypothetical protein